MYRTQESGKFPNELEQDDHYEFSGATLKISDGDSQRCTQSHLAKDATNTESAVLSISDEAPSIHSFQAASGTDSNINVPSYPNVGSKPNLGSPRHFFSFRSGQFERAVADCVNILLKPTNDTEVKGSWLLTEVSHWDHEHERVYILTTKSLLQVKYDFIALRILQHFRIRLIQIDTIVRGKITYPQSSFVPERNDDGIRIMWNKGQPIPLLTSWNPFTTEIPWKTIKNHPLNGYADPYNSPSIQDSVQALPQIYSVEDMYAQLVKVLTEVLDFHCDFKEGSIIMENYIGIGAVIHNKHNFGFFKVRGKFSF